MFKKIEKDHLELACPDCSQFTKVSTKEGVQCSHCATSFKGLTFKQKKWVSKGAGIAILATAIYAGAEYVEDERLPYNAEYRLMSYCVNEMGSVVSYGYVESKIETCSCAIRAAVNRVGVSWDRNEPDEVLEAFSVDVRKAMRSCD